MKANANLLVLLFITLILFSCKTYQTNKIIKVDWLIGTWEIKSSKGAVYETWKKNNNYEFEGKSYIIKNSDTIVLETIKLIMESDDIFYIPTVKNQNKGLPVRFEAKKFSKDLLLFVNKEHDFPQNISYKRITKDSLVAKISGMVNGQVREQSFKMRRIE